MDDSEGATVEAWWADLDDERRAELRALGQEHLPQWAEDALRDLGVTLTVDRYWPAVEGEPPRYPLPGVLRDLIRAER